MEHERDLHVVGDHEGRSHSIPAAVEADTHAVEEEHPSHHSMLVVVVVGHAVPVEPLAAVVVVAVEEGSLDSNLEVDSTCAVEQLHIQDEPAAEDTAALAEVAVPGVVGLPWSSTQKQI